MLAKAGASRNPGIFKNLWIPAVPDMPAIGSSFPVSSTIPSSFSSSVDALLELRHLRGFVRVDRDLSDFGEHIGHLP
jgi:hypothetical protein